MDLDSWESSTKHQSYIYQPSSFLYNAELLTTENNGLCNDACTAIFKGERYESTIL